MSFVGTRPEVVKYVKKYKPEYLATLLLPAGITSEASIRYKDEAELLDAATDVDKVYVNDVLPGKMKYNLESIKKFSFNELHCRCLRNWDRQQFIKEDFRAVRNYPDEDTQNIDYGRSLPYRDQ